MKSAKIERKDLKMHLIPGRRPLLTPLCADVRSKGGKEGEVLWIIIDKFFHPIKNVLYFPKLLAI